MRRSDYINNSNIAGYDTSTPVKSSLEVPSYQPCLNFDNELPGNRALKVFFKNHLLPLVHEDLLRLANMVRPTPNFLSKEIVFRYVLGISEQLGGLALYTSLLRSHFPSNWSTVTAIVSCEVGSIIFILLLS